MHVHGALRRAAVLLGIAVMVLIASAHELSPSPDEEEVIAIAIDHTKKNPLRFTAALTAGARLHIDGYRASRNEGTPRSWLSIGLPHDLNPMARSYIPEQPLTFDEYIDIDTPVYVLVGFQDVQREDGVVVSEPQYSPAIVRDVRGERGITDVRVGFTDGTVIGRDWFNIGNKKNVPVILWRPLFDWTTQNSALRNAALEMDRAMDADRRSLSEVDSDEGGVTNEEQSRNIARRGARGEERDAKRAKSSVSSYQKGRMNAEVEQTRMLHYYSHSDGAYSDDLARSRRHRDLNTRSSIADDELSAEAGSRRERSSSPSMGASSSARTPVRSSSTRRDNTRQTSLQHNGAATSASRLDNSNDPISEGKRSRADTHALVLMTLSCMLHRLQREYGLCVCSRVCCRCCCDLYYTHNYILHTIYYQLTDFLAKGSLRLRATTIQILSEQMLIQNAIPQ